MAPATNEAMRSDAGMAIQMPFKPQKRGNKSNIGIRKSNCRVKDKNMLFPAWPML